MSYREVRRPDGSPTRLLEAAARAAGTRPSWGARVGARLDNALAVVAPQTALRRQVARAQALLFRQAYPGASRGRLHADWNPVRTSADGELLEDLPELRARSRDLVRGDAHAAALIRTLEDNIVGTGIRVQARTTAAETGLSESEVAAWNRACESVFNAWAQREADATGHATFWDLQRQVLRSMKADGEALVHPIMIPDAAGPRRLRTALEIIEPERLSDPLVGASILPGKLVERIRGGVEIGNRSQAVAYWIATGNPDDPIRYPNVEWQRVRRYREGRINLLHVFRRERPGQHRGVPILAPVLLSFRTLAKYLEAELTAARVAACIAAFVRRSGIGDEIPAGFEVEGTGTDHRVLERLEPGVIEYLDPGEEIQSFAVNRPGNTFDPFVTRILRSIAAAVGLPYELLVRDFSRTNYSSMRAALLETRRGFRADQTRLIEQFAQPVYELVITEAYLSGLLPRVQGFESRREALLRTRWVPPAWGWVDPTKEIQASRDAVAAGLSTLADEAAHQGQAWDDIATARAAELRRLRELEREHGLPEGALSGQVQGVEPSGDPEPADDDAADGDDAEPEQQTEEQDP